jgi:hypothetical protein
MFITADSSKREYIPTCYLSIDIVNMSLLTIPLGIIGIKLTPEGDCVRVIILAIL